ncbi:hypothetical protein FRB99_002589 [Tulasnella sp. 403]|nr:hypothetical protein FRB99_002589 [Tulasnella sp. 403]
MDLALNHHSALSDPGAFVHPLSKIIHAFSHRIDANDLQICIVGKGAETILACLVTQLLSTRIVLVAADRHFLKFAYESLAIKTTFLVLPPADTTSVDEAVFNGGLFADRLYNVLGVPRGCFDVIVECSKVDTFVQMTHRLQLDNQGANARGVLLHDSYPDDPDLRSSLEQTDPTSCADCRTTAINLLNGGLLNKIKSTILKLAKKDVDSPPLLHENNPATWFPLFSPHRLKAPLPILNESVVTSHSSFDIQDPHSDANPPRGDSPLPLEHQRFAQDQVGTGTGTSPPVSVPLSRSSTLGTVRSFSDEDHAISPQASTVTDSPVVAANPSFGKFKLTAKPSCSCRKPPQKKARHERRCPDNPNRADNDIYCDVPGCGERFTGGRKDNLKRHKLKQHGVGAQTYSEQADG